MPVTFHTEKTKFKLGQKLQHKRWINLWIESQGAACGDISIIFTSNQNLRSINREYLNHNYFTDVITFYYTDGQRVSGDIFISVDQVRINAAQYGTHVMQELRRVMVHGVLHLLGFGDDSSEEKRNMSNLEEDALHLWLKEK